MEIPQEVVDYIDLDDVPTTLFGSPLRWYVVPNTDRDSNFGEDSFVYKYSVMVTDGEGTVVVEDLYDTTLSDIANGVGAAYRQLKTAKLAEMFKRGPVQIVSKIEDNNDG